MSLKWARDSPITADAGQDECAEDAAFILAGLSATVHTENEAGRTHSEDEWEKTANGFKKRRIGTQDWTVSLRVCFFSWPGNDAYMACSSVWHMPPSADAVGLQGL